MSVFALTLPWRLRMNPHVVPFAACTLAALGLLFGAGCASPSKKAEDFARVVPQFLIEVPQQDPSRQLVTLPVSGVQIPVSARAVLSEVDIANVELVRVDLGLCLLFEFRRDAQRDLLRVTSSNLGRRLVVTLNFRAFGARVIDAPIGDGRLLVFIELPDEELTTTAVNLKRTAGEIQAALEKGKGRKN